MKARKAGGNPRRVVMTMCTMPVCPPQPAKTRASRPQARSERQTWAGTSAPPSPAAAVERGDEDVSQAAQRAHRERHVGRHVQPNPKSNIDTLCDQIDRLIRHDHLQSHFGTTR